MSTEPSHVHFPGARRWHASLPALATTLTCLLVVGTVGFAGFAARQLAAANERQTAMLRMREQLNGATVHLERANRLIAATAKVVQAASHVQQIDQSIAEQRNTATGLQRTTKEAIAALKADKAVKGAAREKAVAKLNAEMKAQLAALATKEKELTEQRQPLAENLSEELGRMLAAFAAEAAKAQANKSQGSAAEPPPAQKQPDQAAPDEGGTGEAEPRDPAEASAPETSAAGASAPANGGDPGSVRPGREAGSGIGSGKQVEQ